MCYKYFFLKLNVQSVFGTYSIADLVAFENGFNDFQII